MSPERFKEYQAFMEGYLNDPTAKAAYPETDDRIVIAQVLWKRQQQTRASASRPRLMAARRQTLER